ncbi:putative armadillo-like helical protein [Helianthus annuus]|uniref:Armadillo-like helical protein n=2 Tax=Helianthus annuus TaxID=4232 RepID=A0A9K3DHD8_HELAN|nr:putative armadillo-like helical protein [Helianthus annuus]
MRFHSLFETSSMDQLIILQSNHHQQQQPPIKVILSNLLLLTDRICHTAVDESKFYKLECAYVGKQVHRLTRMLRFFSHFVDSTSLYERPVRGIFTNVGINLNHALTLVHKCRHRGIILRLISIAGVLDFRKVFNLLDVSMDNMKWLLSVYASANQGIILTLPPIASNDTSLALVWSCIASLHTHSLNLKIEAALELSTLARDSDRNKDMIVIEGGVAPLLKLLKHELQPETQIAGAMALFNLANDRNRVTSIFNEHGVPVLAQALRNSYILVQIEVAKLIARMAEHDGVCQEAFARKNVIETLVRLLSTEGKINKFLRSNSVNKIALSSSIWPRHKKEGKLLEVSRLIVEFNTNCCRALWMLARENVANCRKITETTKGLLCLAKLIENEKGELRINCLMTVMEITSAAENNLDIRKSAFKNNSPAAKAITDQLLRLIDESDNAVIKIVAIRAIGHLARTFPARQTRVISPLVKQLCDMDPDVATESVIALGKFTCPENYLRAEHAKSIVEFEGVQPALNMLRRNDEKTQYHALILLCYLAMHAGSNEQLHQARILTAFGGAGKTVAHKYSELRDLVARAVYHLKLSGY